jgi:hypothetical protein
METSDNIVALELFPIVVYGIWDGKAVPLNSFSVLDPADRQQAIDDVFAMLMEDVPWVRIGNTIIKKEDYSSFRIE